MIGEFQIQHRVRAEIYFHLCGLFLVVFRAVLIIRWVSSVDVKNVPFEPQRTAWSEWAIKRVRKAKHEYDA